MDGVSIDDQFSKLHPCFPPQTRIAVVGGGPSGLSAAYALCKLGYSNVTVLEKHQSPGGMCESVEIQGRIYDLGGQVLAANSAPSVFHLAGEVGAETEEMDTHKFALIDSSCGALKEMNLVEDYVSVISLTLKLQDKAKASGRIGVHAVSEIAPELAPEYLKNEGFPSVPKSVIYGYTASGYGYVQDMPYAYIHEFTRTSMAGKIRRSKEGTEVTELAMAAAKRMGGETESVVLQRKFKYFPHVNSQDMKDGFYDKLEFLLQGQQNTYYAGGLMAFELTERNSSYALELVGSILKR
ncbi:UNVERIFIED_CONTAM: hypothetical protein Sradi_1268100 [Sesamum radiatum]|uniref:Amine oxidase domain-containing protein n=1 Tax=Sesamum radiatum TaxID=300843 RepID=A0AAW2UR87_SESRA